MDPMKTFDPVHENIRLARMQRAIQGRRLSGEMAYQVNEVLGILAGGYHDGDKVSAADKVKLQAFVDCKIADGVQPADSLLTAHQRAAQSHRKSVRN